jgi:hypothetical protein
MKGAFVIRLGPETRPSENHFEGWIEEVDSGKELRFHSNHQLLKFLAERFQAVFVTEVNRAEAGDPDYEQSVRPAQEIPQILKREEP